MSSSTPRRALRLAVTGRWLVVLAALLLFVGAAIVLGRWQWERTQDILAAERAALAQPVPVQSLFADAGQIEVAGEDVGRPVTVTGAYDPALQTVVTSRSHDGEPGVWIVTGIPTDDGRVAAVVRGWLPSADAPGATPPTGPVEVTGVLHPDEAFYAGAVSADGTVVSIAHDQLAALWDVPVLPGFVVLRAQVPGSADQPIPVDPTVQTADVPFPLQNFVYAFQWWLFALFAVVVYVRWLWTEAARSRDGAPPVPVAVD